MAFRVDSQLQASDENVLWQTYAPSQRFHRFSETRPGEGPKMGADLCTFPAISHVEAIPYVLGRITGRSPLDDDLR